MNQTTSSYEVISLWHTSQFRIIRTNLSSGGSAFRVHKLWRRKSNDIKSVFAAIREEEITRLQELNDLVAETKFRKLPCVNVSLFRGPPKIFNYDSEMSSNSITLCLFLRQMIQRQKKIPYQLRFIDGEVVVFSIIKLNYSFTYFRLNFNSVFTLISSSTRQSLITIWCANYFYSASFYDWTKGLNFTHRHLTQTGKFSGTKTSFSQRIFTLYWYDFNSAFDTVSWHTKVFLILGLFRRNFNEMINKVCGKYGKLINFSRKHKKHNKKYFRLAYNGLNTRFRFEWRLKTIKREPQQKVFICL